MAATNFSIDTPISITGFVGKEGIGGVWFFWSSAISAVLVTSGVVATYLSLVHDDWLYSSKLFVTVGVTTVVWVVVTLLTPPVDDARLADFVRGIRPGSPGWAAVAGRHGITQQPFLGRALLLWLVGLVALFSLNFGVGTLLLLKTSQGLGLLAVAAVSLLVLWIGVRRFHRALP